MGAGLRLTTAKFLSPNGQWLSKIGVAPDVSVELPDDATFSRPVGDVDPQNDLDVARALNVLSTRQALSSR